MARSTILTDDNRPRFSFSVDSVTNWALVVNGVIIAQLGMTWFLGPLMVWTSLEWPFVEVRKGQWWR